MLSISLPESVEAALIGAAHRAGQSVDEYLALMCADALSLELDRARLDSYLAGTPAVTHARAVEWLEQLASGVRPECPR